MQIKGTITRLVQGTRKDRTDDRVFIRPTDAGVLRQLPGEAYIASGEIPSTETIEGRNIGDEHTISVEF